MQIRRFLLFVTVFALLVQAGVARADVILASPFTSHMVMQREMKVPVWGTAAPGERITVEFAGQKQTVVADQDGHWRVTLKSMKASADGRTLKVTGSATAQPILLEDVLVGEVWLCSGQSNMDFTVAKTPKYYFAGVTNEATEVAAANYPNVRLFSGEWTRSLEPQTQVAGVWKVCAPENVREFSAIGYFFARDLSHELNVPVGVLTLTYGASTAQAWIRREAIAANPKLKPVLDKYDADLKTFAASGADRAKLLAQQNANLAADEKARAAGEKPARHPRNPDPVQDQHNPTVLFNGMIAPVIPFAIRGVLWYQGESITSPHELFPLWNETLIKDWRKLWGTELPFFFCQLASLQNNSNNPEVRAMQAEALKLPNTAMAVTIDIGDAKSVHPGNKQEVGYRLTRIALANVYGQKIEYSGPVYLSMKVASNSIALKFSHVDGGLVNRGGPLKTFEIAGADGKFVPAEAKIVGKTVVVSAASISAPVAARYAWSNFPDGCNLYNATGLPAPPFRTDAPGPGPEN